MEWKERVEIIKKSFSFPYSIIFSLIFISFILINIFLNKLHITLPTVISNVKIFGIFYIIFSVFVAFLVALNLNLVIMKIKQLKSMRKSKFLNGGGGKSGGSLTAGGIFAGLLGGACPACFVGLFPAFLGLFGISATPIVLPLWGLEIQAFSIILLIISVFLLTKSTCKVKPKK